jgi:hypothetical protein
MSAVREVKYLRELQHPNVIEVRVCALRASFPPLHDNSVSSLTRARSKLLDVFSSKTNLNLVLEFLDTDLEMIIKDRSSLVFLPADIKSWMAMTFRGLEFCHRNFILHRVRGVCLPFLPPPTPSAAFTAFGLKLYCKRTISLTHFICFSDHAIPPIMLRFAKIGSKAKQLAHCIRRPTQARRLWFGA